MTVRPAGFGHQRSGRREKTREHVIETALRLFAERGYVGVRVEDVAAAAGISRATFYKYFSEREEILAELFARLLGSEPASAPPGDAQGVLARVRTLLMDAADRMVRNEQLAKFVYSLPVRHSALLGEGARPPVLDTVERMFTDGVAAGVVRDDVPVSQITAHVGRAFEAAMRDWAEGRTNEPADHLGMLLELAFHGIVRSESDPRAR